MAKIDTTKIEGFDGMSADEKLNALLGYEFEEPKQTEPTDVTKLKTALSKSNSEAAEYKRLLREKQTESERAEADRLEKEKNLQAELEAYRNKERISNYKAQLMTAGIDAETASVMANALPEGVSDDYFAATKAFIEAKTQSLLSESLNKQPNLSVGMPPNAAQVATEEENKLRHYFGLAPKKII